LEPWILWAVLLVFPVCLLVAGVSDVGSYVIPNWVSILLAAAFLAGAVVAGMPWPTIAWHAGTGAAMFLLGFVLFALRAMGGGDVKLLAACALWTGWPELPRLILYVALFGGVFGLLLLAMRRVVRNRPEPGRAWVARLMASKQGIPYGAAIAAGGLIAFPHVAASLGWTMGPPW
jgi:prepilin peptidase CpaA